jgi:phage gpG-like protein
VNLHNGNPVHAHLTYNGTTLSLTLTDTVTNAIFTTSTAINIPAVVGANTAYVGFTAGTYVAAANQSILNWTYSAGGAPVPAATPTFTPGSGTYTSAQTVTIADSTPGAKIYYTTNGTTPTTASTLYSGPVTVSASETLQAIATATGYTTSAIGSATYTINTGTAPIINDPTGFSSSAGLNFVAAATLANGTLQLSSASGGIQANAVWYATPVNVQSFTTDFTFQLTSAAGDGFTFALQNAGATALGRSGSSLGYQGIGSSVAIKFDLYDNSGEGSNSTGFYTNGASPTVPAVNLTPSGVNLHNGNPVHAHLTYNGTTLSLTLTDTVTNAIFTTSTAMNIPAVVGANTAYVGFTAGTYVAAANQSILNWTYSAP